jgi:hypothetical protein
MDLKVVAFPTAPHLQFQKLLQAYQADFGFKFWVQEKYICPDGNT